jgi:hypothetical protein
VNAQTKRTRVRVEQKYVVLADGVAYGTKDGGAMTRDAAWLLERWFHDKGVIAALAVRISNRPEGA